ncbi:ribosome small subunit-dependent GTPase A [Secundilactobacillus paracollinoides]|uniref:Small ribosomal subunit biogenesis GTPase RsgA n=1 Tax=Secundilactobacillus paracollinoides TaxID=240427 RepID=A0A1B2J1A8_9LACO|nr:ribosome small subunit-dependent GTPase A [Secundilactobacillus paracollinoides]ANZ62126.1 ribosome small subunit-dependent GTPase A [Secundilactobacillus paracollinoides]ANZ63814.1 ribosome small subunit-dependent GTPase A [Secundilactobacillus paracollinoides]ANZ68073.1 ribosome small subunit-dependent GTPase A [Secundilactobacillus paracollinoides]
MAEGQIRQSLSGFYDVVTDDGETVRTRARGNFRNRKITPLVGDRVTFEATDGKDGYILEVLPRRNQLQRPPVANVDQAIVATAVKQPDFTTNLLDRQLLALEIANIEPVIYFTKTDLLTDAEMANFDTLAAGYRKAGFQVILTREPFSDAALTAVKAVLKDKVSVIMGQTGAGKSTLLNHVAPDLDLATGEISAALNRGKHTTRRVQLLTVADGLIADTPGFSSYEAFSLTSKELGQYFPEFKRASVDCRFRGCVHVNEPGCAVKEQVANGEIMKSRYDNYLLLYQTLKNQKPNYKK